MERLTSQFPAELRSSGTVLLGILALALILRVWGITFALPYDFTPDEIHEIVRALKLGAGEYTWTMGKGGLYLLLFVKYGFLFVFWWLTGRVGSPSDFAILYLQDPTPFYLAGRLTVALMGALTCLVVYLIGRRLYDWRVGLLASFLGATAYYHGLWSHYINVDIGMTLAVWACVWAYIEYERSKKLSWLLGSGALAGVAVAFKLPGAVVVVPLLLAMATPLDKWTLPGRMIKRGAIFFASMIIATAIVAPEVIAGVGSVTRHFSSILEGSPATESAANEEVTTLDLEDAQYDVTVMRGPDYLSILLREHNIALTIAALLGAGIGLTRRNRWDGIWTALIVVFLGVMTIADRPGTERYLLPIVPALWLLGARAVTAIAGNKRFVSVALVAAIVAHPIASLARQNYMWTRPDTRVIAKQWIEANVPANAKILMDGMEYRFIQSPPLNPNDAAVTRRVIDAEDEGARLSRGISTQTLDLYAEAAAEIAGPKYDLYSTYWGLDVEELSYYVQACFDYVVTSSDIYWRYRESEFAEIYPESARFYEELPRDPRFREVLSVEPSAWETQGPTLHVYEVLPDCE